MDLMNQMMPFLLSNGKSPKDIFMNYVMVKGLQRGSDILNQAWHHISNKCLTKKPREQKQEEKSFIIKIEFIPETEELSAYSMAIISKLASSVNVSKIKRIEGHNFVVDTDAFKIEDDLWVAPSLETCKDSKDRFQIVYDITLFSDVLNTQEIQCIINRWVKEYSEIQDCYCPTPDEKYYFMHKEDGWTAINLHTNRSFENIFFDEKDELLHRLRMIKTSNEEYDEFYKKTGNPRQLGILLHGPPGTGKTSITQAISNEFNLHIIEIDLRIVTKEQLMSLNYNPIFTAKLPNGETKRVYIPMSKRMYVFPEVDLAIGCILKRETIQMFQNYDKKNKKYNAKNDMWEVDLSALDNDMLELYDKWKNMKGRVTLDDLLEAINGSVEASPGRIIIFCTNHPEILDPALLRPGRLDFHIHLDKMKSEDICKLYELYFGDRPNLKSIPDKQYTPAEVAMSFMNCIDNPESSFKYLDERKKRTLAVNQSSTKRKRNA